MRIKRRFDALFLVLALTVTSSALAADPPPRFPGEHISLADWQSYLDEVKSIPDVRCEITQQHELYCVSDSLTSIWVFTEKDNPAYPAVATGVLVVYPHADGILFRAYYAGNEPAFRAWEGYAIGNPAIVDKWMRAAFKGT
jgi:hypothetical protein